MNSYAAKQVSGVMDQKDFDVVGVFAKGNVPQFKYPRTINYRKRLDFSVKISPQPLCVFDNMCRYVCNRNAIY